MKTPFLTILLLALFFASTPCQAQTCTTPTNVYVTPTSSYSAQVSWSGSTDSCRILVTTSSSVADPQTFTYWDIDTIVTTNPAVIAIRPDTRYFLYMQALCTSGSSDMSLPVSFDSQCDVVYDLPWSERFEAGVSSSVLNLPCWINEHVSGDSYRYAQFSDDDVAGNASMKMMFPASDSSVVRVTLPPFHIASPDTFQLDFSVYRNDYATPFDGVYIIRPAADSTIDTTFVPVNVAIAGDVNVESAPGWYSYAFPFTLAGVNSVILLGCNSDSSDTYIDDIRVRLIPSCLQVKNVALRDNQPDHTVVGWTSTSAARYQVVLTSEPIDIERLAQVPAGVIVSKDTTTADSLVYTTLASATHYYMYVRGICSGSTSDWSTCLDFVTSCASITLTPTDNYFNGFENEVSMSKEISCWDVHTSSEGMWPSPISYSYYARTGTNLLYLGGADGGNDTSLFVLPDITNAVDSLRLRFWVRSMAFDASANDSIIVGVLPDAFDISSFIPVARFQSSLTGYEASYEEFEVLFDNYTGTEGRIALQRIPVAYGDGSGDTVYYGSAIDDVTVDLIPSCRRVSSVLLDSIAADAAVLSLQGGNVANYEVLLTDAHVDPLELDSSHLVFHDTIASDTLLLTSLSPVTDYYLYLRTICGGGDISDFSKEFSFRTAGDLPYYQDFDTVSLYFPVDMTEYYVSHNLDSVVAGVEKPMLNPFQYFEVNNIIAADTTTIRYNVYGDNTFHMLSTPLFLFDGTPGTTLSFDVSKREYDEATPAADSLNNDDLFYILAADPSMSRFIKLDSWTNDTLGLGNHSLRNDITSSFSTWTVDLSALQGTYRILFAIGSLEENDDYDVHFDNISISVDNTYDVTLDVNNPLYGHLEGDTSGIYEYGSVLTVTAVPETGFVFVNWSNGATTPTITFTVVSDTILTAIFSVMPTSMDDPADGSYIAYAEDLSVVVLGADGRSLCLYDAAGLLVASISDASASERLHVSVPGIYILRASGLKSKAIVVK